MTRIPKTALLYGWLKLADKTEVDLDATPLGQARELVAGRLVISYGQAAHGDDANVFVVAPRGLEVEVRGIRNVRDLVTRGMVRR